MRKFYATHLFFSIGAMGLGRVLLGAGSQWNSFSYGLGVFCVNLGLLIVIVRWAFSLLNSSGVAITEPRGKGRRVKELVLMCFLVFLKLGFVGTTVYIGMVRWNLPPLHFVVGGLLGLFGAAALGIRAQNMIMASMTPSEGAGSLR